MRFPLLKEWIIVHDHKRVNQSTALAVFQDQHPKIREVFNTWEGNFGNPERDFGLSQIPVDSKGFIYFLDDDNYAHINMWTLM